MPRYTDKQIAEGLRAARGMVYEALARGIPVYEWSYDVRDELRGVA